MINNLRKIFNDIIIFISNLETEKKVLLKSSATQTTRRDRRSQLQENKNHSSKVSNKNVKETNSHNEIEIETDKNINEEYILN